MTVLHAGGKFDHSSYKVSAGLHGVGVSAVNAVSETLRLEIKREGRLWFQEYHRGAPVSNIVAIGETNDTGTRITFKPDHEIFTNLEYSFDILANRLRELAFLNSGLIVHLIDERGGGRSETYEYKGGIKEFVSLLSQAKEPVHDDVVALLGEFPSSEGKGAGHRRPGDSVDQRLRRADPLLHEQRRQQGRRHASDRSAHGADPHAE